MSEHAFESGPGFKHLTCARAGELFPNAVVAFDRDLEPLVDDAVFIARWGHLYVASLGDPRVVWCWYPWGAKWDDLSGGRWADEHQREWTDCLALIGAEHEAQVQELRASLGLP